MAIPALAFALFGVAHGSLDSNLREAVVRAG
jgi:hypothetical protein